MTTVELLKCARQILVDYRWTKYVHARDNTGREVYYLGPKACRFCAEGALCRATASEYGIGKGAFGRAEAILDSVTPGKIQFTKFNDKRATCKADIVTLYDRAIRKAQRLARKAAK